MLTTTTFDARYYEEHKRLGMDYLCYGEWQQQYGRWLVDAMSWSEHDLLDIGCACGALTMGLTEAGAKGWGIDVNESTIALGREKWPGLAPRLMIMDAANLHLFDDGSFAGFHASQTAEHWRPRLVPVIMAELRRVAKLGALWFSSMPVYPPVPNELDDPTHYCLRPLSWWHEALDRAGWNVVSRQWESRLKREGSFLSRYATDWDWFVAQAT